MKFKQRLLQMFVFVMLALLPCLAFAAEAVDKQEWWQLLLTWALPLIGTILTPVLGALAIVLLRRWGINMKKETINDVIGKAVHFGEGKALAALNAGNPKTGGAEKLDLALKAANMLLEQYKLPAMGRDALVTLIESKLGEQKVEEKKQLLTSKIKKGDMETPAIKLPKWATDE
jgi:hypothetical protein